MRLMTIVGIVFAGCFWATAAALGQAPAKAKEPAKVDKAADPILQQLTLSTNADPDSGSAPLNVKFEAEIYAGDEAQNPKFEWDFGDGSKVGREQNPTHTFKKVGKYKVVVTAKDAAGRLGRDELEITVEAAQ